MCSYSETDVLLKINQSSCISFTKSIIIPFQNHSDFHRQMILFFSFDQEKLSEIQNDPPIFTSFIFINIGEEKHYDFKRWSLGEPRALSIGYIRFGQFAKAMSI